MAPMQGSLISEKKKLYRNDWQRNLQENEFDDLTVITVVFNITIIFPKNLGPNGPPYILAAQTIFFLTGT